jgi:hypothetical protein
MITHPLLKAAPLALLVAAAGCASEPGPHSPDFGNAVRHNIAVQAVSDQPSPTPPDAFDGTRAGLMVHRYKLDKVEPPQQLTTSDVGSGS